MILNNLHTPTDSLNCTKNIKNDILEYLSSVQYLHNLTKLDRPYAKDLDRDEDNKIIVDITAPHILEDVDYFRESAIHFEKHGNYTTLHPNSNPNSEFYKFWKEEARRCREGLIRESDGEWITGDNYFYLNYSPIMKVEDSKSGKSTRLSGFPNFWDQDYLYFHYISQAALDGKHGGVLKVRGSGYSFKASSMLAKVFKLGDTSESTNKQTAFAIADESEYLIKDGVLNKFEVIASFLDDHTPWPRSRLISSVNKMVWKMGFKDTNNKDKGTLNSIQGVTLKNDSQRARGKRGCKILWEEFGDFMDGLTSWQIARPSVEDGNFAFGTMIAFGTGGTLGSGFKALEEIFYHSKAYNILDLPNVWDKNTSDLAMSAIFIPAYMNRNGCYDKNGNSDVTKALVEILQGWYNIRDNSSDHQIYLQAKAEIPIVPQDAMLRKGDNIFPVGDLKEHAGEIQSDIYNFTASHYVGDLVYGGDGTVTWKTSPELKPIREFPIRDNLNKEGAIEIFQMPIRDSQGNIPRFRYISGIDSIDDDSSTTNSLPSIFIFDRFTEQIVAEYTGRLSTANAFYEKALKMLKYYNATCNYENDKKGLYAYFSNHQSLQYLCQTPQILKDMEMIKADTLTGNKSVGTNSSKNVNAWGRRLQADWMREVAYGEDEIKLDENGNAIVTEPKLNLHKIRSIAYVKEAIGWNIDGNFDRVSAMGMLMILREDLAKHTARATTAKAKTLSNDKFFGRKSYRSISKRGSKFGNVK